VQSHSSGGISAISQAAATAALNGSLDEVRERTANLQHRRDILYAALRGVHGLSCTLPQGALYVYCDCTAFMGKRTASGHTITNDIDFTRYLLDSVGVAVVQGTAYGLSPYFRASFAASEADLSKAALLIREACRALGS
jgi:aspartate aminotransferase